MKAQGTDTILQEAGEVGGNGGGMQSAEELFTTQESRCPNGGIQEAPRCAIRDLKVDVY